MTAQDLKNSILQLTIQGKLVPQNPSDEPASELIKRTREYRGAAIKNGTLNIDKKHTADPISEDNIPYDLPSSWEWVRFADIVTFNSGKTPARQDTTSWSNGVYPWVSIADMISDGVTCGTKEKVSEKAFLESFSGKFSPAGTMIMSFKLTIGKMSILGIDAVHNEAIISIFPTVESKDEAALKAYLFKILPLIAIKGDSKNAVKGKTLNATSISNLMIPLPPIAEQERIVAKIEELLPLIEEYDAAERQLTALNENFPDKLRKSILQQAVQGKLTERDPSDEPASELLKRIRAEKVKLIAEGKIKKEKPLPEITEDEKPFEIPESWRWVRLYDICKSISDGDHQPPPQAPNGVPFLVISNVSGGTIDFSDTRHVPQSYYDSLSGDRIAEYGDLLFTVTGSYGIPIKVNSREQFCFQRHIALLKLIIDWDYIYYLLKSPAVQQQCDSAATGTAQKTVGLKSLRKMVIPLPPLDEQKRIVAKLDELLPLCEKLK